MPLHVGDLLLKRYRIERPLGQGYFGCTWLATDQHFGDARTGARPVFVAVKELLATHLADDKVRQRFVNEARLMRLLSHPNIVTVFDFLTPEDAGRDAYYTIMEFLDGGSLDHLLTQGLSVARAVEIATAVLSALTRAHQPGVGIIHRDVKPGNVLLSADGSIIKLGDFGIAHDPAVHLTARGNQPGTVIYMSPEQVRGGWLELEPLDGRSDLYSVGALLYEMLTNRHYLDLATIAQHADQQFRQEFGLPGWAPLEDPLRNELDAAVQRAIARAVTETVPEPPRHYNPDIPPALEAIVLKALAKKSQERYATAGEMIAALKEVETLTSPVVPAPADRCTDQIEALLSRSQAASARREFGTAQDLLTEALALDPENPRVIGELGKMEMARGNYRAAVAYWKRVVASEGSHPAAISQLARCYCELSLFDRAIEIQEQALRDHQMQDDPLAYQTLAFAYWEAHRYDEAIWALDRSIAAETEPRAIAQKRALSDTWRRRQNG